MKIDYEKILTEANEKLAAPELLDGRTDQVDLFRRFLKIETERLRMRQRFGLGGFEIAAGRSYLVDLLICRICQLAVSEVGASESELSECALVALGGYGRREMAPCSDIDILFLHGGRRSKPIRRFLEQVLYWLWDLGLTVGHSYRSVGESIAIAKEDLHSRNSMSDARLITGNQHLFKYLVRDLDQEVFQKKREIGVFLEMMRAELEARYEKFGRSVCVLEPNVKESAGGLRDLHTVLWVSHALHGCRSLDDLRAQDIISGAEYVVARRAYDFILRVRNEAHFTTGRKFDLLTLDLQPVAADNLGYRDRGGLMASEILMREYYQKATDLHRFTESFLLSVFQSIDKKRRIPIRRTEEQASGAFVIKHGRLVPREQLSEFDEQPLRLFDIFSAAQLEGIELSDELKLAVRRNLGLVNRGFRSLPQAGKTFAEMLGRKGRVAPLLRAMHETGFLGRFLPEFGRITFLVQHDFYHKYTIDEHTLKAVEALDQISVTDDSFMSRFSRVFAEISDAAPLYLGLLLHDIGKGSGDGHVAKGIRIAERICRRLDFDERSTQLVLLLVRHHLLMSHISQRRDLSEERLIGEFARKVEDVDALNMLLLLTYADISGVGPGVWNDWKGALLWDLYTKARGHLTDGKAPDAALNRVDQVKRKVLGLLAGDLQAVEVERHLAMMPERYLRNTEPDQIAGQLRMMGRLGSDAAVTEWRNTGERHSVELTICARDSAGLFARIAGTLTAQGVNILSADLNTREDGIVIDIFKVSEMNSTKALRSERWPAIGERLKEAIAGRFEVSAAVETWRIKSAPRNSRKRQRKQVKPSVRFDSEASASSTVIEVRAEDEPGLAYTIASTLARVGLDITFAKIATEKNHALDVFYVTDSAGQKLSPPSMSRVESALLEALAAGSTSTLMKEAV